MGGSDRSQLKLANGTTGPNLQIGQTLSLDTVDQVGLTGADGHYTHMIRPYTQYAVVLVKDGYTAYLREVYIEDEALQTSVDATLRYESCIAISGMLKDSSGMAFPGADEVRLVGSDGSRSLMVVDSSGGFSLCLQPYTSYQLWIDEPGYRSDTVWVEPIDPILPIGQIDILVEEVGDLLEDLSEENLKEDALLLLQNIFYDFNKADIRPGAAADLDLLVEYMERYPTLEIELMAHTDCRGRARYNLKLSLDRAESARAYL